MILKAYIKEFSTNWKLALPIILSLLGHSLVQFIDNVMVGQLGATELAGISLANSFISIPISLAIGFSTCITPIVAESTGEQNKEKGKSAFRVGQLLCTLLSVILCILLISSIPIMDYMKQDMEVVKLAGPYLIIAGISLIPMGMFQGYKQFADGMSYTKPAMIATLVANLFNIIINYLLIFGHFGCPKLGIMGAAIGTLAARIIGVFILWYLLKRNTELKEYLSNWTNKILDSVMIKKLLSLGVPSAIQMFFEVLIFTAAIWLSGVLGKYPQAANQIALNLASTTFMVAVGLSAVATIRAGNHFGAKTYKELRRIVFSILFMGIIIELIFALFFFVFHSWLPTIYLDESNITQALDNKNVIELASTLLIYVAFFQLSDGIQVIMLGALRGIHDVVIPSWIAAFSYWIVAFPICYYLGLKTSWGSEGIWLGLLVGLTVSAALLFWRFNHLSKKMIFNAHNK